MQQEHVEQALSPIEHLYKTLLKTNCKLFNPPIPRFLFGSCCLDLTHGSNIRMGGHGEKMVGEHCRIRNNLKSILLKNGIRNMRVLDTLGTLTHKSTVAEQLTALKSLVDRDNVHLTAQGYKALAEGIFREALNFGVTRSKGKHSLFGLQMVRVAEWHGFVSNQGVGKVSLKAAKRPLGGRCHPYQKKKSILSLSPLCFLPPPPQTPFYFMLSPLVKAHFYFLVPQPNYISNCLFSKKAYTPVFILSCIDFVAFVVFTCACLKILPCNLSVVLFLEWQTILPRISVADP